MMAGILRDKVSVETTQKTPDGMGGFTSTPVAIRAAWCIVTMPTGKTEVIAQRLTNTVTLEIKTRPSTIWQPGRTAIFNNSRYLIEAVLQTNRVDEIRVLCSVERRK